MDDPIVVSSEINGHIDKQWFNFDVNSTCNSQNVLTYINTRKIPQ